MFFDDPALGLRFPFRRSRVRVEILLVLLAFGPLALADLARIAGADIDNVRGALRGNGRRYRYEHALIFLGLVDARMVGDEVFYELTSLGASAARALRVQVERRRGARPLVRS